MLIKVKAIMIFTVAIWGIVGALHNLVDWNGTLGAVGAVTSMATINGAQSSWQATSNPIIIWTGALFIVSAKILTALLCTKGAVGMWRAKVVSAPIYHTAKNIALAGCGVAIIMLFAGFIVIAESWFELWRSESMIGPVLQSAFRYGAMIALIALFVASKD